MTYDHFIFKPGKWKGQGSMDLNLLDGPLLFTTTWDIRPPDKQSTIYCTQQVHVQGLSMSTLNEFWFSSIRGGQFMLALQTEALGRVVGKGIIDDKKLVWEIDLPELGFAGLELYEASLDHGECFNMRAEYATTDQFRSKVQGAIERVK